MLYYEHFMNGQQVHVLVCCGKERAEHETKAIGLVVDPRSYPDVCPELKWSFPEESLLSHTGVAECPLIDRRNNLT